MQLTLRHGAMELNISLRPALSITFLLTLDLGAMELQIILRPATQRRLTTPSNTTQSTKEPRNTELHRHQRQFTIHVKKGRLALTWPSHLFTEQPVSSPFLKKDEKFQQRNPKWPMSSEPAGQCKIRRKEVNLNRIPTQ